MTRSHTTRFVLITVGILLFYAAGIFVRERYGISVVIRNDSGETLQQVSVKVEAEGARGKTHGLPDLAPGDHQRVFVQPVTESHINLEFMAGKNMRYVQTIVGYAETGYCGSVAATIRPGGKVELDDAIPNLKCWKGWFDFISVPNSTPSLSRRT